MRTGRPKTPLVVSAEERVPLDSRAHRSRTAPQVARRARIVLACADGLDNKVVAKKLRMTPQTVGRWRRRFIADRLDGLYDEPRPGTPRKITDEPVEAIVIRTLERKPRGGTQWSMRSMAKARGRSPTTGNRALRALGLHPHRTGTFQL